MPIGQAHHLLLATLLVVLLQAAERLLNWPAHSRPPAAAVPAIAAALPVAPAEGAVVATAILHNPPARRRAPIRAWLWVSLGGLTVEMRHQLCRLLLWRYQGSDPWGGMCHPHGVQLWRTAKDVGQNHRRGQTSSDQQSPRGPSQACRGAASSSAWILAAGGNLHSFCSRFSSRFW